MVSVNVRALIGLGMWRFVLKIGLIRNVNRTCVYVRI